MKKFTLFTIVFSLINIITLAQGCLPEGITFTNQESIDNFQSNYAAMMQVYNNAYGCNSVFEIEAACQTGISNSKTKLNISLLSDPKGNVLLIAEPNGKFIKGVKIFNIAGQKVLQIMNYHNGIDISTLNKGLYIAEMKTETETYRQKFIVK